MSGVTATTALADRVRSLARDSGRLSGLFGVSIAGLAWTCATDGRALLLHLLLCPDRPADDAELRVLGEWVPGEVETAATHPEYDLAPLLAFLGAGDPFVRCGSCKGSGECRCECGHEHDCQDCGGLGGEGGEERPVWVDTLLVDANRLACWLAAVGADAGRVRVGVAASKPAADHLWVSDPGGRWHVCLMPMDRACVPGADSRPRWTPEKGGEA